MSAPATTTDQLPARPGVGGPCADRRRGSSARCRKHASRLTSSASTVGRAPGSLSGPVLLAGWDGTTYGPALGARFLTRDPLESVTREAYGYASANPANLVDPWGLQAEDPSYCPEGGPGADHPESPPTSLEVAACYSSADSSGGLLDGALDLVSRNSNKIKTGVVLVGAFACTVGSGGTAAAICIGATATTLGWSYVDARAEGDMGAFYRDVALTALGTGLVRAARGDEIAEMVFNASFGVLDFLLSLLDC